MEKPFWLACFTHMFLETFLLIQIALIPTFVREFELSLLEASLAVTIPMVVQLIMNIPSGMLAERFSMKHLLFASMVIEGVSALFLSQTRSFWALVLGVSVMRISSPIYHISGLSRISMLTKREQLSRAMGFHNAFGNLGAAIGVVSLSVFLPTLGWRWIYLFWSLPILAWGFIVLRFPQLDTVRTEKTEEELISRGSQLSAVFSKGFLIFLLVICFRAVGVAGANTFIPTYFVMERKLLESTASLIFGLGPFMGIAGSIVAGTLGDRVGAKKMLSLAILGSAFSLIVLSLLSDLYLLVPVFLILSFFDSLVWTPMNTLVVDMTPEVVRGLGFSVYFMIGGLISAISPIMAAKVIELSSILYLFPFSAFLVFVGLVILQSLRFPKSARG